MYEIDFLPAGEGTRSGDAIALRYTVQGISEPVVGIIDAGFAPCGPSLVNHVRHYYETEDVDFVLNTHIDTDHTGGLTYVLENLNVTHFLVHRPDQHGYPTVGNAELA